MLSCCLRCFNGKCCINKIIIIFDKKLSFLSLLLPSNFTSFHFSRPKTEKKRTQSMLVVHCYEYLSLLSVLLWATHYSTGSPTNNFQRVEVDINAEGMVSYILQIFLRFSVSSFIVVFLQLFLSQILQIIRVNVFDKEKVFRHRESSR